MSEVATPIHHLAPPAEAANTVASLAPKPSNSAGADDKPPKNATEPPDVGTSHSSESRMLEHVILPKTPSDSVDADNKPQEPPKNVANGTGCSDDGASHTAKTQDGKSPVLKDAVLPTTSSDSADTDNEPPKDTTNGTARPDVGTSHSSELQIEGSPENVVLPSPRGPEKLLNKLGVPLSILDRMIEAYLIVRRLHGENKRQSRVLRLEQCAPGHR